MSQIELRRDMPEAYSVGVVAVHESRTHQDKKRPAANFVGLCNKGGRDCPAFCPTAEGRRLVFC